MFPVPLLGPWRVGDELEMRTTWNGGVFWNECKVKAVNPNGTYRVAHVASSWSEGRIETDNWPAQQLRFPTIPRTDPPEPNLEKAMAAHVTMRVKRTDSCSLFNPVKWNLQAWEGLYIYLSCQSVGAVFTIGTDYGKDVPLPN
jgi:hypothetical protein